MSLLDNMLDIFYKYYQMYKNGMLTEVIHNYLFPSNLSYCSSVNDCTGPLLTLKPGSISWTVFLNLVLPSLFPDDPECDYHNLDQVHKGDEASAAYLLLPTLSKEEQDKLRYNMLKYCGRDTYATVKLYEELRKAVK